MSAESPRSRGRARQHARRVRYPESARRFNAGAFLESNRVTYLVSKFMKSLITIITSVFCSFAAVAAPQAQTEKNPRPLDPNNRDSSVKPGDNFFLFANGNW